VRKDEAFEKRENYSLFFSSTKRKHSIGSRAGHLYGTAAARINVRAEQDSTTDLDVGPKHRDSNLNIAFQWAHKTLEGYKTVY
jgi:hypothetical protein